MIVYFECYHYDKYINFKICNDDEVKDIKFIDNCYFKNDMFKDGRVKYWIINETYPLTIMGHPMKDYIHQQLRIKKLERIIDERL